ncbi:MAG TPA: MFS transporter [Verrucomicrobiota bacterium]|nr:MFS transporter [Verrucomicrobiota bacterium]HNT16034.1 MFS transporter [Verrucomicrobiota bacterium]
MSNAPRSALTPWYRGLTGYHWFVFAVASAAWFFDCLDQRLFSLARIPALKTLMTDASPGAIQAAGKEVTAIFLIGWGIGGIVFGALGDRFGRAKMLTTTVLLYSVCTGLTFFSHTWIDFALLRMLTGLGVGGVFGLAVALVAETVPDHSRTGALGMLQVLSAGGNISAGLIKMLIDHLEAAGTITAGAGWRWAFLVGVLPALLVVLIQKYLRETDPWLKLKAAGRLPTGGFFAPYLGLLSEKRWRKNLLAGAVIASTGVVAYWGIGEYGVDLQRNVFQTYYQNLGLPPAEIQARLSRAINISYTLSMLGAAIGMWVFTKVAQHLGRRPAFALGFSLAMVVTVMVYWKMKSPADGYWMLPLMTSCQSAMFAGFAIYLPELFPSRLRSTGTSFCYNLGRFAAAIGSFFSATLATEVYGKFGSPLMERYSAMTMCAIFLFGLLILPFAPETKGKPLPED